ncbi:methyltransferase [Vibrio sp. 10N.261.51.F12]|uniref:methyltransferase n=1 Tax=Vibrio sp. 10N.261.51.F12 TaxID=3229679 RepID=UPI0035518857
MNQQQFELVTQLLKQHQCYWRTDPFYQVIDDHVSWQDNNADLLTWLLSLSHQQIAEYKSDPLRLTAALIPWLPDAHKLSGLTVPHRLTHARCTNLPRGLEVGIPGRKLDQITSLSQVCLADHHGSQWLEWCSGKGYLGRLLASQSRQTVTSFEFQSVLCELGQDEANKLALPMTFVQGDAFHPDSDKVFDGKQHAVALHACGDLHVTLIEHAVRHHLPAVTLSPCCYHLIRDEHYRPMSQQARHDTLQLSKQELRIPLQETITGGERVRRHREQEMTFRLGFDALCRELALSEGYISIPSIKKSMLAEGFGAFCLWAANQKSLQLPSVNYEHFEQIGHERYWKMEALSLIQGIFRRPLELWLALDKALYLEEHGYQAEVFTFCEVTTTPRNLVIHGVKEDISIKNT